MHRLVLSILLALTLCPSLSAQDEKSRTQFPRLPKPQAVPNGSISGTVLCGDTHRPARGARLFLSPLTDNVNAESTRAGETSVTDSNGAYNIPHVAPGEYTVLALLPGYALPIGDDELKAMVDIHDAKASMRRLAQQIGTVTVHGSESSHFDLILTRGAALSGQVLFSDGSPATQVLIDVQDISTKPLKNRREGMPENMGSLLRRLFNHQSLNTDDLGHFRIAGLAPGTYSIAAVQSTTAPSKSLSPVDFMGLPQDPEGLHVYSGDTLHKASAKHYDLRPGDETSNILITIPLDDFHKVSGIIQSIDGRPLQQAALTLTDCNDETFILETQLNSDGAFQFPLVPAGTYTLRAKNGRIMEQPSADPARAYLPGKPAFAFADGSMSLIVKSSDITDALLSLKEIPLPPQPKDESPASIDLDN